MVVQRISRNCLLKPKVDTENVAFKIVKVEKGGNQEYI